MEGAHQVRGLVVGSWTRVLVTAGVILALWVAIVGLAVSGHLGGLRYLNVPVLHPYPPAGYVQNPFNPGDKADLVRVAEASQVKADLLTDGQTELRALEAGDPTLLDLADTGRAKAQGVAFINQNNAAGVYEVEQVNRKSLEVGRLADPNDSSITWAVKERGTGTINYYSKSSRVVVRQVSLDFEATYWLQRVGGRYLIADVLINANPAASASQ